MYYESKDLNLSVGIVSLNAVASEIKKTQKSMDFLSKNYPCLAVLPENLVLDEPKDIKFPVYNAGNCITSLYDIAIKNSPCDWIYIVFAGTVIRKSVDVKLSRYVESEKDVIFPVMDRIWNFVDGSMNGILINKNFYNSVGSFITGNNLKVTKLAWAAEAVEKGAKFKAIVGAFSI